jgi:Ca2+-binding EF-hand superfamily protein
MRGTVTAVLVLGFAVSVSDRAMAQAEKQAPANPIQTVLQLDANGDMAIERDEVPESGIPAFEKLLKLGDANKNGKLDPEELRTLVQKVRGQAVLGPARFLAMDKDGDGRISRDEFTGVKANFGRFDVDQDGFITRAEAAKAAPPPAAAPFARLQAMDKDGDGKISKSEFSGPAALFGRLDADHDGFITMEEARRSGPTTAAPPAAATPPEAATIKSKPIAEAEVQPNAESMPQAEPGDRFKAMDKDGDGKIGLDEFVGPKRQFDRIDTNQDGYISSEEFRNRPGAGGAGAEPRT